MPTDWDINKKSEPIWVLLTQSDLIKIRRKYILEQRKRQNGFLKNLGSLKYCLFSRLMLKINVYRIQILTYVNQLYQNVLCIAGVKWLFALNIWKLCYVNKDIRQWTVHGIWKKQLNTKVKDDTRAFTSICVINSSFENSFDTMHL